jgi:MFS transporter, DHA1 family, multidrug resistance protein
MNMINDKDAQDERMAARKALRPALGIIVAMSMLQPFAVNVLAPASLSMSRALGTSYATIQLTLTVYLATVALSQLIVGPLSDRFGRRPCVLVAVTFYTLGSMLGAVGGDITTILLARALQAVGGGTTFALARAIIRDTAERDEAASLIGYATMAMVIAPMIAPLTGGFIDDRLGWRAIFWTMAVLGLIVGIMMARHLNETAPAKTDLGSGAIEITPISAVFRAFPILLRDRSFRGYVIALACTTSVFFIFISAAPYVVVETFGGTAQTYGMGFVLNAGGYMIGNFLSGRYGQKWGTHGLIRIGAIVSLVAISAAMALAVSPYWSVTTLFVPMLFNALGNGLTIPAATAAGLSARPDFAGAAAGVMGSVQLGTGAFLAWIASWTVTIWPPSFIVLMWLASVIGGFGTISSITNRFRRNS